MTSYLIESSLCLLVMIICYRVLLAKTDLHQLKRGYLIVCIIIPMVLPLINIDMYYEPQEVSKIGGLGFPWFETSQSDQALNSPTVLPESGDQPIRLSDQVSEPAEARQISINWSALLLWTCVAVSLFLLARLAWQIVKIQRLIRQSGSSSFERYKLVLMENASSPYSFFKYIFMARSDYESTSLRSPLLAHELVHVNQWHSVDILLIELTRAVFWFNPLYWLLAKSIRLNHEFIADAAMIGRDNPQSYQKMLLDFYQRPRVQSVLVSPSDYSFIKHRFQMMQKRVNRKATIIRTLLIVPILAGLFFSLAMDLKPRHNTAEIPSQTIEKTTDSSIQIPVGFPTDSTRSVGILPYGLTPPHSWTDSSSVIHHEGIDITARAGRSVIATGHGIVEKAEMNDREFGNYVLIKHQGNIKTLYASLSQLNVAVGEQVNSGQQLGVVGNSMKEDVLPADVLHVHYRVMKAGEWVNPMEYIKVPQSLKYYTYLNAGFQKNWGLIKALDLGQDHIIVNLDHDLPYDQIIYDTKKIFFISDTDSIVKAVSELSSLQWKALRMLNPIPYKPRAKTPPTQDIANEWGNGKMYGIWIDNKRVDNEVMSQYTRDDFATYFKSRILKNAKNYGKHKFQLNLTTHAAYDSQRETQARKTEIWKARTRALFSQLGEIN